MSRSGRVASRSGRVVAICAAALVLTVPAPVATVTPNVGVDFVMLTSDGDADTMVLTCTAGQVKSNGGAN